MKWLVSTFILALAVGVLLAAPPKEEVKKEMDNFLGKWTVNYMSTEGMDVPGGSHQGHALEILNNPNRLVLREGGTSTGIYEIDPTTNPKLINIGFVGGPRQGQLWQGIYILDDKHLQLAVGTVNNRPTHFGKAQGQTVYNLIRQQP